MTIHSATEAILWGRGSHGPAIREVQGQLALRGFIPGPIDGDFGAKTERAVQDFHSAYSHEISERISLNAIREVGLPGALPVVSDVARHAVIIHAAGEVGQPRDAKKYWKVVSADPPPYPRHWCGCFGLWSLHQAGLGRSVKWKSRVGFLAAHLGSDAITRNPLPGDMVYFARAQHHAVFVRREGDLVVTIDGNQGAGDVIGINVRPFAQAAAYYSIREMLDGTIR